MDNAFWLGLTMGIMFVFLASQAYGDDDYVSPLKQWKNDASPIEINCSEGRFLMINPDNEKPACLFPSTSMIRFAENGWIPVRNLVLENPKETTLSGHGGEFTKRYFSYFEIKDQNSIIVHKINDKSLVNTIRSGDKIVSNCIDNEGSSEITVSTLVHVNSTDSTVSMTHEKQTWPGGFCDNNESILEQYYTKFFASNMNENDKLENLYSYEPAVIAFYETYDDVQVSVRDDHVSYFSGSNDSYFVRMNLVFDENQDITDVDFHCYFQRVHQYELPQEHIEQKIAKYDCREHGKTVETKPISETKTKDSQTIKKVLINLENISTLKPNSMEWFYYPESPTHEKPNTPIPKNTDTYGLFMLIRLPEWMGGDANDASAYRAYSAKSLDDACIVKYWPDDGRQRIENPCQGGMYRIIDGAMTTGLIHRSTPMTALPYLDLSVDENGLLYVEPPRWTKTENGVIGYGREISFDDFRNGSEFLAESFAKAYPKYPPIPLQFAGYDLSEIAPEQYRTNISYLDFPDNSGKILMTIGKQSVGTGHTYWTKSQSESFQLGDTTITVNKYVFEREDSTDAEKLRTYEVRFKDDGFYYAINGKNLEFIKREIVKNFFPEHEYNDMLLISKNSD